MAAEALEAAAKRAGVAIQVETQGSAGSTPLSHDAIACRSAVIFAVDVGVRDRQRFAGKPVVSSGVKRPIDDGDAMIAEALRYADDPNAPRVEGEASGRRGLRRRRVVRGARAPGPDDRRVLHDPVRGRGRSAHRARLPVRRLRDRRTRRRHRRRQHALQPSRPRARSASTTPCSTTASSPTSARILFVLGPRRSVPRPSAGRLHRVRDRRPARHRAGFVMGALAVDLGGFGLPRAASSAASSAASWPASSRCGSPAGRWLLGARPDARPAHPAARDPDLRRRDDRGPQQAARLADGPAQRRPEEHE